MYLHKDTKAVVLVLCYFVRIVVHECISLSLSLLPLPPTVSLIDPRGRHNLKRRLFPTPIIKMLCCINTALIIERELTLGEELL